MKRAAFLKDLRRAGCQLKRHGKRHDLYLNPANGKVAPVPRHREIKNSLSRLIRAQLQID